MASILNFIQNLSRSNVRLRPDVRRVAHEFFPYARSYLTLDCNVKNDITRILDHKTSFRLLGISGMCAELAYRDKTIDWIETGIICHVIENFSTDFRENFRYLALLDDVSKLKSIDFADRVLKLSEHGSDICVNFFQDWLSRPIALNNIESFDIEREISGKELIYRQKKISA